MGTQGKAVKIINLDENDKIISDSDTLRHILQDPKVKDKPVCVISITGAFRQGKSFLLNFLLQYLTLTCSNIISDTKKWLQFAGEKLQGFEWKYGIERHTTGILMWSEIFISRLPSGEEVAIVLLDTQGTFDNVTTMQQCAAIFAISTLISSVQIYNLKSQINQNDLQNLECFSGFGKFLAGQNANEPFQNLWFLIRDWQFFEMNGFGEKGGKEYLNSFFNKPNQPEELKRQNDNIRKLFKNLHCFLLPYPGTAVATKTTFQGNLADVDKEFLKQVQKFVSAILAPKNLVPKIINGQRIRTGNLVGFIESYCQHFMGDRMPKLETMFRATAFAHLGMLLSEAEALYENKMNKSTGDCPGLDNEKLAKKHASKKLEALQYFKQQDTMAEKEVKKSYEEKLSQNLDRKFDDYKKNYEIKLSKQALVEQNKKLALKEEECKNLQRQAASDRVTAELTRAEIRYRNKMQQETNDDSKTLTKNELNRLHQTTKAEAIAYFSSTVEGEEQINEYREKLSRILDSCFETYEKSNEIKLCNKQALEEKSKKLAEREEEYKRLQEKAASEMCKAALTSAKMLYTNQMQQKINSASKALTENELSFHHQTIKAESINHFTSNVHGDKRQINEHRLELSRYLDSCLDTYERTNNANLENERTMKLLEDAKKLTNDIRNEQAVQRSIAEAEKDYDLKMTLRTKEAMDDDTLELNHELTKNDIIREFRKNVITLNKDPNMYEKELSDKLDQKMKIYEAFNKIKLNSTKQEGEPEENMLLSGLKIIGQVAGHVFVELMKANNESPSTSAESTLAEFVLSAITETEESGQSDEEETV